MIGRSTAARSKGQLRFERHQLGALISRIEAVAANDRSTTLIAIAGRGGAGKTTLAARTSARLDHASVVHTDDFARPGIPGWDWRRFTQKVIEPLLRNEPAQYQRYDWDSDQLAEWHRVEPRGVLIVEGVSSTRRELDVAWDLTIWVEAPTAQRLRRGIARDGEHTRQQWEEVWEPQEDTYVESQHPDQRADVIVDLSDHRAEAQPAANTIDTPIGTCTMSIARPREIATVVRLREDAARWMQANGIDQWNPGELPRRYYQELIAEQAVWLMRHEQHEIAMVSVTWSDPTIWGDLKNADAGYIHGLVVDREYTGNTLGAELLKWVERHIMSAGCRLARLDCVATNQRLRHYYVEAGYRHMGNKDFPTLEWARETSLYEKQL